MPWLIQWTDQAIRDLSRLDSTVAKRVVAKLEQAAGRPEHFFKQLKGTDDHKLRIGDWRLLAVLQPESRRNLGERVGHPTRVYD